MINFMDVNDHPTKYPAPYAASKIPLILKAITGYSNFTQEQFTRHLPEVYGYLCDLILMNEPRVRDTVHSIIVRIGKVHQFSELESEL